MEAFKDSKIKADSLLHEKNYTDLNKELMITGIILLKQHPESMLATLFKSMKEPPVLNTTTGYQRGFINNYQYYKKHYWDGITFMDDRIIRTPFFLPKVERYFREIVVPCS